MELKVNSIKYKTKVDISILLEDEHEITALKNVCSIAEQAMDEWIKTADKKNEYEIIKKIFEAIGRSAENI